MSSAKLYQTIKSIAAQALAATPMAYLPVRIQRGPAKGAKWTLLPFSSNWRHGGQDDILAGLQLLAPAAGKVCWDFGAHFGIYTVAMAALVGDNGQVVAFEPESTACKRLRYHVRINGFPNIRIVAAAASEIAGRGNLIVTEGPGSSFSHFRYEDEADDAAAAIEQVDLVVPDELVARGEIRMPDLIKVDVQGHGAQALRGSSVSIRTKKPVILFSNHSSWEFRGARELLEPIGYMAQGDNLEPISWDEVGRRDTTVLSCT